MQLNKDYTYDFEPRFRQAFLIIFLGFLLILGRLYYLQGIKGDYYRLFSEENSIRPTPIPSLRGMILDRNGKVLVSNRPAFNLVVIPQYVVNSTTLLSTLKGKLKLTDDYLSSKWSLRKKQPAYKPIIFLEDISWDIVSWVKSEKSPWHLESNTVDLRGVEIQVQYDREYDKGDIATHLLGYVAQIDSTRLERYQKKWGDRYQQGNRIGVRGLEEIWDINLRGMDGYQEKVVNAVGREIDYPEIGRELVYKERINGEVLKLTIDKRLQEVATTSFKGKTGSAVALNPHTGEVLLLYSAPSFDLNKLTGSNRDLFWKEISSNKGNVLLNRAFQGTYPPGSTYKIVVASAALQEGAVKEEEEIFCPGFTRFGGRKYRCWKAEGHGKVNLLQAITESCDVFFYEMGQRLGPDILAMYARAFGLGKQSGISLPGEKSGLVPTTMWKLKNRDEPWQPGETLSIAIGQGYNLVTPLQQALMLSVLVNGGKKVIPFFSKSLLNLQTKEELITPPPQIKEEEQFKGISLNPKVLDLVRQGTVRVVADKKGTAHRLSRLKIPIGGKTGTAQVVSLDKECKGINCEDHAWFVAFAPVVDPQIAVAILVEHGGHGSSAAAPIAGKIISEYLDEK